MNGFIRLAGTALLASCATMASAATFIVINTNDSGPGSLRQAIVQANTNPGPDSIDFNIASSARTISVGSALPNITNSVTIDGTTQPGFVDIPLVELNGGAAPAGTDGLRILAANCTVRGLVINRFSGDGVEIITSGSNIIQANTIGLAVGGTLKQSNRLSGIFINNSANNIIGGPHSSDRNIISGNAQHGIHISGAGSTNNQIIGNFVGVGSDGSAQGNAFDGILVTSPSSVVGGRADGAGNVISGNGAHGIEISPTGSQTRIEGNLIGTDPQGANTLPNGADGIFVNGSSSNTIGGAGTAGNLLSGNGAAGVELNSRAAFNSILGNRIGTDVTGTRALRNSLYGVVISGDARMNRIGDVAPGEGNVIAFHRSDGVLVLSGTNNSLRGNSIFSNDGLGIDLGVNNTTPNDVGDVDTGPNDLQNFPLLTAATNLGSALLMVGSLSSRANTSFTLDFFSNDACDPSGNGEGQVYVGSTNLTTDASGDASFVAAFPISGSPPFVTATATDPFGNTSEFSPCTPVVSGTTNSACTQEPIYPGFVHLLTVPRTQTPSPREDAYQPYVSEAGDHIAFFSYSDRLVAGDTNLNADVFVFDRANRLNRLVSVNLTGTGSGNGFSGAPSISGDGRYVAFQSDADDLVAGDDNGEQDIFVRDMVSGVTTLVTRNLAGTGPANGYSYNPVISADGKYVAFVSYATDLTSNSDTNGTEDVFIRDITSGVMRLVSITASGGRTGSAGSYSPTSVQTVGDSAYVVFVSDATNLVAYPDTNNAADIFVRDVRRTTHLISFNRFGNRTGNQGSGEPSIAVNATGGVYVAFTSLASDLVANDDNSASDVFFRDVALGTTSLISVKSAGASSGNESSGRPSMGRNLRYVAFDSRATDLVAGDNNSAEDIFVRDVVAGTTILVTRNCADTASADAYSYDARISADGRYVVFASAASDLVPGSFPNRSENVYRHDLVKRKTSLISQSWNQTGGGTNHSYAAALSTNATVIAFESLAPNLARTDTNGQQDVFAWVSLPPETLGIKFVNGRMQVQWSSETAPEFSLQQATVLTPIIVWSAVTNVVMDDGVSRAVTISGPFSQRYYRLRKP